MILEVKPQTEKSPKITEHRWSKHETSKIGPRDLSKYKILRLDEPSSDFEDENAEKKVPEIRPR